MKKLIYFLLGLFLTMLILSVSSCSKQSYSTVKSDSTVVTRTITKRDTLIAVPGDSVKIRIPIYELKSGTPDKEKIFKSANGRSTISVKSDGKDLVIDSKCEAFSLLAQLLDTNTKLIRQIADKQEIKSEKEVEKKLAWWQSTLMWSGAFLWVLMVVWLIWSYLKPPTKWMS